MERHRVVCAGGHVFQQNHKRRATAGMRCMGALLQRTRSHPPGRSCTFPPSTSSTWKGGRPGAGTAAGGGAGPAVVMLVSQLDPFCCRGFSQGVRVASGTCAPSAKKILAVISPHAQHVRALAGMKARGPLSSSWAQQSYSSNSEYYWENSSSGGRRHTPRGNTSSTPPRPPPLPRRLSRPAPCNHRVISFPTAPSSRECGNPAPPRPPSCCSSCSCPRPPQPPRTTRRPALAAACAPGSSRSCTRWWRPWRR